MLFAEPSWAFPFWSLSVVDSICKLGSCKVCMNDCCIVCLSCSCFSLTHWPEAQISTCHKLRPRFGRTLMRQCLPPETFGFNRLNTRIQRRGFRGGGEKMEADEGAL